MAKTIQMKHVSTNSVKNIKLLSILCSVILVIVPITSYSFDLNGWLKEKTDAINSGLQKIEDDVNSKIDRVEDKVNGEDNQNGESSNSGQTNIVGDSDKNKVFLSEKQIVRIISKNIRADARGWMVTVLDYEFINSTSEYLVNYEASNKQNAYSRVGRLMVIIRHDKKSGEWKYLPLGNHVVGNGVGSELDMLSKKYINDQLAVSPLVVGKFELKGIKPGSRYIDAVSMLSKDHKERYFDMDHTRFTRKTFGEKVNGVDEVRVFRVGDYVNFIELKMKRWSKEDRESLDVLGRIKLVLENKYNSKFGKCDIALIKESGFGDLKRVENDIECLTPQNGGMDLFLIKYGTVYALNLETYRRSNQLITSKQEFEIEYLNKKRQDEVDAKNQRIKKAEDDMSLDI